MAGSINPAGSNSVNMVEIKRAAMEAKLGLAIKRAQKKYANVNPVGDAAGVKGPSHLGRKIDIKV